MPLRIDKAKSNKPITPTPIAASIFLIAERPAFLCGSGIPFITEIAANLH